MQLIAQIDFLLGGAASITVSMVTEGLVNVLFRIADRKGQTIDHEKLTE